MKKAAFSKTYSGLQCSLSTHHLSCSPNNSRTSPLALPPQRARPPRSSQSLSTTTSPKTSTRSYASVRSRPAPDFRDNFHWPCRHAKPHTSTNPSATTTSSFLPTPYEIFDLPTNAVYTKHKFYELVKIYHPDRTVHATSLPSIERLERYRLIVQAHEILSDPAKRRAYDAHGAGWGERASAIRGRGSARHYSTEDTNGGANGWSPDDPNSPFGNATWEDWERWYRARQHSSSSSNQSTTQAYQGTYVNPNMFASMVIILAVLSGVAQATGTTAHGAGIEEKALAFTEETSRFLNERQDGYLRANLASDGRVRHFLERRDPRRVGLKDEEELAYRKLFGKEGDGLRGQTTPAAPRPPPPAAAMVEEGRRRAEPGEEPG